MGSPPPGLMSDSSGRRSWKRWSSRSLEPGSRYSFSSDPLTRRKWIKAVYLRLPFKSFLMFIYLYFFRLGILDGRSGYYFCKLRAVHEFNISSKIFELAVIGNKSNSDHSA